MALFVLNCENSTNISDDFDAIQENWIRFAEDWNDFNTEGCVSIYTDDAAVIPPEMSAAAGKEAIGEFYDFLFTANQSAEYAHTTESITIDGDLAIEHGNFSVAWVSNEGEPWTFKARVIVHWTKNESRDWKIKKLLFNTPPPESE